MTTTTLAMSTARTSAARPLSFAHLFRQMLGPIVATHKEARAHRELMKLNDHLLQDIGLTRYQLEGVMRR
jgi:uncharacterized protein YjiS (DUF1127 family)